ncbi:MAG: translocation/assembly module TamB domain-containing protein [Flavobacteriales bacterium]
MLKRILKISRNVLIAILLLLAVGYFAIQTSPVQTWLTQRVASYLSGELKTTVMVGRVDIDLWARLVLEDLYIEDQYQDTLAYIDELHVGNYTFDKRTGNLEVGSAEIVNPYINIIRHEGDSVLNHRFIVEYLDKLGGGDSAQSVVQINNLKLVNGRVNYVNENKPLRENFGIDWNHMMNSGVNVEVKDLLAIGDTVTANILQLAFIEQSGFNLKDMQADLMMVPENLQLNNAYFQTNRSEVKGNLSFFYNDFFEDFEAFDTQVKIDFALDDTKLYMDDLSYFSSSLLGWNEEVTLSGKFKGKIASLRGKDVQIDIDEHTRFKGSFNMDGLPEIDHTFISLDIDELTTNQAELNKLQLPPYDSLHYLKTPANFAQLGLLKYSGSFTGFINDFVSKGRLETAIGNVNTDLAIRLDEAKNDYVYRGNLGTENFDIGSFYNSSDLGTFSCDLYVDGKSLELNKMNASFSGDIHNLSVMGYNYTGIMVNEGQFALRQFTGDFSIDDPNASVDFTGSVDFRPANPVLNFDAHIQHMNLTALHLLREYDYSSISGHVRMASQGFDFDRFEGELELDDVTYCAMNHDYEIKHLLLESDRTNTPSITLKSDIADAKITGDFDVKDIGNSFMQIVSHLVPSFHPPITEHARQKFELQLTVHDATQITQVYLPDLKIANNTTLRMNVDESADNFSFTLSSDSVSYMNNHFKNLVTDAQKYANDPTLYATVFSDKLIVDDFEFENLSLESRTDADTVYTDVAWGNGHGWNSGDIKGRLVVHSFEDFIFQFRESSLTVNNNVWLIKDNASASIAGKEITINNFDMSSGEQWVKANGSISENPRATLNFELHEFDIGNLNDFTGSETKFFGILGGTAAVRNAYHDLIFTNDIILRDFKLNNYYVGYLCAQSAWDNIKRVLRIDGTLEKDQLAGNIITKSTPLTFNGYYRPDDKKSPLDLMATVKDLDLSFINEFLSPGVIEIKGLASGTIAVTGQPEAPQMEGEAALLGASIFVNYLNTHYSIEEQIGIYPDMFTFDHIKVRDQEQNPGYLTGQIMHNNFAAWNFDLFIEMDKPMLAMNTTQEMNALYYGRAYTTGYVGIYGYDDKLEFDCTLKSAKGTTLAMPMNSNAEQTFENFVRFVDEGEAQQKPKDYGGIKLNFNLEVTPDAEFKIIFDEAVGDVMRGRGKGHLLMDISGFNTFNMYGLVEVVEGEYKFTLQNLVNKDFIVKPGGTIAWYGDPFAADLNLQAIYKVNASLYDVVPDPRYAGGKRVPVELVMNLTGKMMNPGVEFDVELPSVDQVTRSRVEAVLSTEQEKNRQAFALLVMKRFISPPNVTSDHNSTGAFGATSSELLSSQVSNWLSQLSDDFDLGFNYRPGDDISNEEIALALSTQLFDDKMTISSNLGVSRNTSRINQNTSNLIGDIRIEYRFTDEGKLKLVVYNESSDYRMGTAVQSPYTQGVGVLYQEEFDTMDELLDGLKAMLNGDNRRRRQLAQGN